MRTHDIDTDEQDAIDSVRDSVRRPSRYACSDRYCGADDCGTCFPFNQEQDEEE